MQGITIKNVSKKTLSALLQAIYMPSKRILFILLLVCAYLLNAIFSQNCEHNLFAYGVYVLAAYTIIIFTIRLCSVIRSQRVLLHKYPLMHKYLTEMAFRAEIALYLSLSINLLYSAYNAIAGIYYHLHGLEQQHSITWFSVRNVFFWYILCRKKKTILRRCTKNVASANIVFFFPP